MTTSPTVTPRLGREWAGRAWGPQPEDSLPLVPAAATGPRSWLERDEDEDGEFHVAYCTCTWSSGECAGPDEAEAARTVHDDAHLPPGQPAVTR